MTRKQNLVFEIDNLMRTLEKYRNVLEEYLQYRISSMQSWAELPVNSAS